MEIFLHSWPRHGDAYAVEVSDGEKENEQSYNAIAVFRGLAVHEAPFSHAVSCATW